MDEEILKSLLKRAKGYSYKEVQEEFAVADGELSLVKRKVLQKYCPPDSAALKTYLELNPDPSLAEMSDEELKQERQRLLGELKLLENQGAENAASDGTKKDDDASKEEAPRKKGEKNDAKR